MLNRPHNPHTLRRESAAISHRTKGAMCVRSSLEVRICDLAVYIIDDRAAVRAAANEFGIRRSAVYVDKTIWSGSSGGLNEA